MTTLETNLKVEPVIVRQPCSRRRHDLREDRVLGSTYSEQCCVLLIISTTRHCLFSSRDKHAVIVSRHKPVRFVPTWLCSASE